MLETARWSVIASSMLVVGGCMAVFQHAPRLARYPSAWRTLLVGIGLIMLYIAFLFWHTELAVESAQDHKVGWVLLLSGLSTIMASLFVLNWEYYHKQESDDGAS